MLLDIADDLKRNGSEAWDLTNDCGEPTVFDAKSEQEELLRDYGYNWESFSSDAERNQIICENHFEQYPLDYRNDI